MMKEFGFIDFSKLASEALSTDNIAAAAGAMTSKKEEPKNPCAPNPYVKALISVSLGAASYFTGLPLSLIEVGLSPLFQCEAGKRILASNLAACIKRVKGAALYPLKIDDSELIGTTSQYYSGYHNFWRLNYPGAASGTIGSYYYLPPYRFGTAEADTIIDGFTKYVIEMMASGQTLALAVTSNEITGFYANQNVVTIQAHFDRLFMNLNNTVKNQLEAYKQYGQLPTRSQWNDEKWVWENTVVQRGLTGFYTSLYELMKKCISEVAIDSARVNNPSTYETYKNQIPSQPNPKLIGLDGIGAGKQKNLLPLIIAAGGIAALGVAFTRKSK